MHLNPGEVCGYCHCPMVGTSHARAAVSEPAEQGQERRLVTKWGSVIDFGELNIDTWLDLELE